MFFLLFLPALFICTMKVFLPRDGTGYFVMIYRPEALNRWAVSPASNQIICGLNSGYH